MDLKKISGRVGELLKKYKYVVVVLLLGIGLMLIPDFKKNEERTEQATVSEFSDPTAELTEILTAIQGAGRVRVLLTLHGGERTVYQTNKNVDADGSVNCQTVVLTDSERNQQGMIQQVLAPEYRGAVVLCQGAGNPTVRLAVIEAVADATGLSTDRISVLKMK